MAPIALGHIEITPGVCGGKPHIAGHRVSVQNVAIWHERMGLEPDEIATTYGLTLGEVYAALAYYHDNRSEVDEVHRLGRILCDRASSPNACQTGREAAWELRLSSGSTSKYSPLFGMACVDVA